MEDIIQSWQRDLLSVVKSLYEMEIDENGSYLDFTADPTFGDVTSNIAFKLAKELKKNPATISNAIAGALAPFMDTDRFRYMEGVKVAGDGYLNFHISEGFYVELLEEIRKKDRSFGELNIGKGKKINIEFVSANPTGPLTVAHGRQSAVGDTLARILKFVGYDVTKEFYLNDCGNQISNLGKSIYACYCEFFGKTYPLPEEGYHGKYIKDIASGIKDKYGDRYIKVPDEETIAEFSNIGIEIILGWIKRDLADFGVVFDNYYSQNRLEKSAKVKDVVEYFKQRSLVYEKEGALWLRTTDLGDQQDKVLIKSDGTYTYRTPDIAYHKDKFERGFEWVIDLWGPDHHAHISTMQYALKMLGCDKLGKFTVLIVQHCRLLRGGREVKMSKRAATYVTLRELLGEVGCDAGRYFFNMRKTDSHLDFDIDVAKKQTMDNPVYYIQYAHARISSIFRKGVDDGLIKGEVKPPLALGREEIALARELMKFPYVVRSTAENLDTERLTRYLHQLAGLLQSYYQRGDKDKQFRVLCEDEKAMNMRLYTIKAVQIVIRNGLELLGISAPERMEARSL